MTDSSAMVPRRDHDRIRRLFELGEYDEETFLLKRSEIRAEQERLREQATALQGQDDTAWLSGSALRPARRVGQGGRRRAHEDARRALRADRGARHRP